MLTVFGIVFTLMLILFLMVLSLPWIAYGTTSLQSLFLSYEQWVKSYLSKGKKK